MLSPGRHRIQDRANTLDTYLGSDSKDSKNLKNQLTNTANGLDDACNIHCLLLFKETNPRTFACFGNRSFAIYTNQYFKL